MRLSVYTKLVLMML